MSDTSLAEVARASFVEARARLDRAHRRLAALRDTDEGYPQLDIDLAAVERSLARIEDGTYGRCEACGNRIGDVRLRALPVTRWCALHQRGRELRID